MPEPIEQLREMRGDLPAVSTDSLRTMRVRMLDSRARRTSWLSRPWSKVAIAGGAAVVLTAGLLFGTGAVSGLYEGPQVEVGRPANATTELNKAAKVVEGQDPVTKPRDDQFVFQKQTRREPDGKRWVEENWTPFWWDSDKKDPGARTPKDIWEYNERFPDEPKALRAAIYQEAARPEIRDNVAGDLHGRVVWIADAMLNGGDGIPAPPKKRAAIFRVLATVPGVKVTTGFKDLAGRPGIFVYTDDGSGKGGSIYAAGTYEYLGWHTELPHEEVDPDTGKVISSEPSSQDGALLVRKVVDKKGDR